MPSLTPEKKSYELNLILIPRSKAGIGDLLTGHVASADSAVGENTKRTSSCGALSQSNMPGILLSGFLFRNFFICERAESMRVT